MNKKPRVRTIKYKDHTIVQTVQWIDNPIDGAGYECRTKIEELPKYSDFDGFQWLGFDQIKTRISDAERKAKYHIDQKIKEKEPDIFDELGFI